MARKHKKIKGNRISNGESNMIKAESSTINEPSRTQTKDVIDMNEVEFAKWMENTFLEGLTKIQICEYFKNLRDSVDSINKLLKEASIASRTGEISRNPQLHGFIFEKLHVYTFNVKAALAHKNYRAYILPIDGGGFSKNSIDISIRELGTNKILRNYQAKCCIDADATIKAFEHGDYHNQRYLVCGNQVEEVKKSCSSCKSVSDCIEYDGICSTPQKYNSVKEIQKAMQSGNFSNVDLSMWSNTELTLIGIRSVGQTLACDAILRVVFMAINHTLLHTENSIKEDIIYNSKELGWDGVKNSLIVCLNTAIGKKSEFLPEFLKNLPSEQVGPVSCCLCGLLVDLMRVGYGHVVGKYSELETYELIIRTLIKHTCEAIGAGVAGIFTEGVGVLFGSIAGSILGDKIVELIGEERLEIAAKGLLKIENKLKDGFLIGVEDFKELISAKHKNLVMEGI